MGVSKKDNKTWKQDVQATASAGAFGTSELSNDVMGDRMFGLHSAAKASGGSVVIGMVTRSGGGSYDCTVSVEGKEIGCVIAQPWLAANYGYSSGGTPLDGMTVIVFLASRTSTTGYIIGVLPLGWYAEPNDKSTKYFKSVYPWDRVGIGKSRAFITPIQDAKYSLKNMSASRRPVDILPGEMILLNEQNCGITGDMFAVNLRGGGSYVRVSRIDDRIRLRSSNLTLWTDFQVMYKHNDEAYISGEVTESAYQGERMGKPGALLGSGGSRARPRYLRYGGFIASKDTHFVTRPVPDPPIDQHDEGVMCMHTSESGKVSFRAGGGMELERYDKIPMTWRVTDPQNPVGNHPSKMGFTANTPFNNDPDQHVHSMELWDAIAWNQKNLYRRFDEHSIDFVTQEEQGIHRPKDSANDPVGNTEKYTEYAERRAGVYIENDGSLVLRDAFGDEIVLNGGQIQLSTPGSITFHVHKHFDVYAKDGISLAARTGAVAIAADDGPVTLIGTKQVNIMGGEDSRDDGGVLIESLAKKRGTFTDRGTPLLTDTVNGVVIRAMGSDVAIGAKYTEIVAKKQSCYFAGDDGDDKSKIFVAAGQLFNSGVKRLVDITDDALVVQNNGGLYHLSSKTQVVGSKKTLALMQKDTKFAVPIWVDVDKTSVSDMLDKFKKTQEVLQAKDMAKPYKLSDFETHIFAKNGEDLDYNTLMGVEGWVPHPVYTLCQPHWHMLRKISPKLVRQTPVLWWKPRGIGVFNGNAPYPGNGALDRGWHKRMEKYQNLDGPYSKKRAAVQDSTKVDTWPITLTMPPKGYKI